MNYARMEYQTPFPCKQYLNANDLFAWPEISSINKIITDARSYTFHRLYEKGPEECLELVPRLDLGFDPELLLTFDL